LVLRDDEGKVLDRNVYWVPCKNDVLDWEYDGDASWYVTPVTDYANLTALWTMDNATVSVSVSEIQKKESTRSLNVTLENTADVPAFFVALDLKSDGNVVLPTYWSDNYVTLFPHETLEVGVQWAQKGGSLTVDVQGVNVGFQQVKA
jgi:exo-1,4-beta-D-glucosaminidase